jgi:hypothetical protein
VVEDNQLCVDQNTLDLGKKLSEKTDETQMDLQAITTSIDVWTKSLLETIADTREKL